jgi:hypothetical protein
VSKYNNPPEVWEEAYRQWDELDDISKIQIILSGEKDKWILQRAIWEFIGVNWGYERS